MSESRKQKINHPVKRLIFLCIGLSVMAFGVAFSIKAALGTSPISSVPYVTAAISGLSVGFTTIIVNTVFILLQIVILRKQYDWFQLLQFPAILLFGAMIDVAGKVIEGISFSNYFQQWILCAIGIVLAICQVTSIRFCNMKIIFDVSQVAIAITLSLIFIGHLDGVREGTVAAAIFVGLITKQTNKLMKKVGTKFLA